MGAVGQIAAQSYRDAIALLQRMTAPLAIAIAMTIVINGLGLLLEARIATEIGRIVVSTLASVASIWAIAPYLLALYRFVLLGEVQRRPEMLRNSDAANRLFAWSAIFAFLWILPGAAMVILAPPGLTPEQAASAENAGAVFTAFGVLIALLVFAIRTMTLVPGAALGAPTSLARALAETRGRFWLIFGALMLAILPVAVASSILGGLTGGILQLAVSVLSLAVTMVLGIALTANVYKWLMDNPR
jgi:hypothetical protein